MSARWLTEHAFGGVRYFSNLCALCVFAPCVLIAPVSTQRRRGAKTQRGFGQGPVRPMSLENRACMEAPANRFGASTLFNECLPFAHFRPGGLEDFAFAFGEALDAVSGNLVEDRVHLAADELGWRQIVHRVGVLLSPEGVPGRRGFDQHASRRRTAKAGPVEQGTTGAVEPLEVGDSSQ